MGRGGGWVLRAGGKCWLQAPVCSVLAVVGFGVLYASDWGRRQAPILDPLLGLGAILADSGQKWLLLLGPAS